jgi:hypothetical protein
VTQSVLGLELYGGIQINLLSSMSTMDGLHLKIAELVLSINPLMHHIHLSTPPCHQKFTHTAVYPQLFLNDYAQSDHQLVFELRNINKSDDHSFGHLIFGSETWELWQDRLGNYVFLSKNQNPTFQIRVKSDFSGGEIIGDLQNVADDGVYPLEYIDMRLYSAWLGNYGDLILHASGVMKDGISYCFVGHSGVGKSTLVKKIKALHQDITVLGEDQVILRYKDNFFWTFGTPWHLDCSLCDPGGSPLGSLIFLTQEGDPRWTTCRPIEGVAKILKTAVIPYYNPNWVSRILDRLNALSQKVPFYNLNYNLDTDPWPSIYNA